MFAVNGLLLSSWIARIPAIRDDMHLTPSGLGLVLLAGSCGAVTALPAAGPVVHRLGPSRTVLGFGLLACAAVAVVGLAGQVSVLMAALFAVGAGSGTWDVAMNVEGADVEHRLGAHLMPRLHGVFSLGTVAGAAIGALAAALHVPVAVHLPVVAVLAAALVSASTRRFLGPSPAGADPGSVKPAGAAPAVAGPAALEPGRRTRRGSGTLAAWREPRTLVVGLFVLSMAFSEGVANDWLAVGLVDGYRVDHAVAAAGFGLFVAAMTAGRLAGAGVLHRWGRVAVLRAGAGSTAMGVLLVVAGGTAGGTWRGLPIAAGGILAWGLGTALAFPVGMSAAADDPSRAAARVSVVATVGYAAFLVGPPTMGLLADNVGVVRAMSTVLVAAAVAVASAGAARPLTRRALAGRSSTTDSVDECPTAPRRARRSGSQT